MIHYSLIAVFLLSTCVVAPLSACLMAPVGAKSTLACSVSVKTLTFIDHGFRDQMICIFNLHRVAQPLGLDLLNHVVHDVVLVLPNQREVSL